MNKETILDKIYDYKKYRKIMLISGLSTAVGATSILMILACIYILNIMLEHGLYLVLYLICPILWIFDKDGDFIKPSPADVPSWLTSMFWILVALYILGILVAAVGAIVFGIKLHISNKKLEEIKINEISCVDPKLADDYKENVAKIKKLKNAFLIPSIIAFCICAISLVIITYFRSNGSISDSDYENYMAIPEILLYLVGLPLVIVGSIISSNKTNKLEKDIQEKMKEGDK